MNKPIARLKTLETICISKVSCVYLQSNLEEAKKILEGAMSLFMRIGLKSVSMDDIAREVGVSKKTIYKYYEDKESLISSVIETDIKQEKLQCETCYSTNENAVQKMINISRYISNQHKDINPTVIYDLQKYYPMQWAKMNAFQEEFITKSIALNITEGQKEKLYREDLKPMAVANMYGTLIQGMMKQMASKENTSDFKTLHLQMVSYHLHGICTTEGRSYLKQHINEITNEQQ